MNSKPSTGRGTTGSTTGRSRHRPHGRAAAEAVDRAEHFVLQLPGVGKIKLPPPDQLAYYAGIAALAAFEVLGWPAALVLGAGHALISQKHNRTLQEFCEALEDAG